MRTGESKPPSEGIKALRKKHWIVYAKKPFGSPTPCWITSAATPHRVALSNERILSVQSGQVTFTYRDRQDKDRLKSMTLDALEFIRRFLLHVLPDGFMRVRHFGFLANRAKKRALPQCRKLLGLSSALPELPKKSAHDLLLVLTGIDLSRCPRCQKGTMIVIDELPKVLRWDSS